MSKDAEFHKKTDMMFTEKLNYPVKSVIRVKNIKEDKIISEDSMNYSRLMFDSKLNMYKLGEQGWILVTDVNFKPVIVEVMA